MTLVEELAELNARPLSEIFLGREWDKTPKEGAMMTPESEKTNVRFMFRDDRWIVVEYNDWRPHYEACKNVCEWMEYLSRRVAYREIILK